MPYDEAAHPRADAGTATGGQFVASDQTAPVLKLKAPIGKWKDAKKKGGKGGGKSGKGKGKKGGKGLGYGTGYDSKNGDPRVRKFQALLNKLGLKDAHGKPLKIDGKLGPRTTEAIKAAQRKHGMKPDGILTPALVRALSKPRMSKSKLAPKSNLPRRNPNRVAPSSPDQPKRSRARTHPTRRRRFPSRPRSDLAVDSRP